MQAFLYEAEAAAHHCSASSAARTQPCLRDMIGIGLLRKWGWLWYGSKSRVRVWSCALVLIAVGLPVTDAWAMKRMAMVIGNARYASIPLNNPENDARVVASTLRKLGFEVAEHVNLGVRDFRRVLREFARRTQEEDGVAVLYYAGHGVQIDGRNYLLPVDINLRDEEEIKDESVDVDEAYVSRIERARAQVRIIILDACRDNPFRGKTRNIKPIGGLAELSARGALIAYSSAPGAAAEDGPPDSNSVYTRNLVKEMLIEGLEVEQMFKQVRLNVLRQTEGRQMPWVNSSMTADFSFNPRRGLSVEEQAKQQEIQTLLARLAEREREQQARERDQQAREKRLDEREAQLEKEKRPVLPSATTGAKPPEALPPRSEQSPTAPTRPAERQQKEPPVVTRPPPEQAKPEPPIALPVPPRRPATSEPAAPPRVVASNSGNRSERCNALLIRASLGEPMLPSDMKFLKEECR